MSHDPNRPDIGTPLPVTDPYPPPNVNFAPAITSVLQPGVPPFLRHAIAGDEPMVVLSNEASLTSPPNGGATVTSPALPNVPSPPAAVQAPPTVDAVDPTDGGNVPAVAHLAEEKAVRSQQKKEKQKEADAKLQNEQEQYRLAKEKLEICRNYFFVGCFGLPWLHFVSVIYFFKELNGEDGEFHTRKYILLSLIVGLIESFIWILWVVVFQVSPADSSVKSLGIVSSNHTLVGKLAR